MFSTRLRISRDLLRKPVPFARQSGLPVRSIRRHRDPRHGGSSPCLSIDMLAYGGVRMEIKQPGRDALSDVTVQLNPGKILYGHNGRITTVEEVLDAFSIYLWHAKLLLEEPDDWPDLLPGLRAGGRSAWRLLEIPFQCEDPDGNILSALRHLRHPAIRTPSRHWPDSIEAGGKKAMLQLAIYRKDVQMRDCGVLPADQARRFSGILRLEARFRETKLVHYVGNNDNVEVIDGKERVVRFLPQHIGLAHKKIFSELENVWLSDQPIPELKGQLAPLGSLIAQVARDPRVTQSFPVLLRYLGFYTGAGSKGETIRRIRRAGGNEMALHSTLRFDSLFSDAACNAQPGIFIPDIERKVHYPPEYICREHSLEAAYGPPGAKPPFPDSFPSYCR